MEKDSLEIGNQKVSESEESKFELKNKTSDYFKGGAEIGNYILRIFGRKDPSKPKSFNLSVMHGINRISLIMFLFALIYLIGRKLF